MSVKRETPEEYFAAKEDELFRRKKTRKNGGCLSATKVLGSLLKKYDEDCQEEE